MPTSLTSGIESFLSSEDITLDKHKADIFLDTAVCSQVSGLRRG